MCQISNSNLNIRLRVEIWDMGNMRQEEHVPCLEAETWMDGEVMAQPITSVFISSGPRPWSATFPEPECIPTPGGG